MKLVDIDKALQICGNNNAYQRILFMITVLTWFSVDFVSITFPLLEIQPKYECRDPSTNIWSECKEDKACKTDDYRETIIYNNIFSNFSLSCQTILVMLIGVTYTLGVFLGAFLGSKFADTFGRKPVILINNFLFAVSCISLTIAPSIYIIFGILFFTGLTCAGGTMITFLMINESLATSKRSLYGTMINSSFSLAGIIYFLSFQYVNNWKVIAYISAAANIISIVLIMMYVIESPRYLYVNQKYLKFFSSLHKLSRINGKSNDYLRYLKSDAIYINDGNNSSMDQSPTTTSKNTLTDSDENIDDNKNNKSSSFSKENKGINSETLLQSDNLSRSVSKSEINHQINEIINRYNKMNSEKDKQQQEEVSLTRASNLSSGLAPNQNATTAPKEIDVKYGFMSLLKYKSLRSNFLILNLSWFYCCFVYYGISMDLKNFTGDIFSNGYVVYSAEAVSYFVTGIIISRPFFGRIKTLSIMCVLNGISCALYFFIEAQPYNKIFLFAARFSITSIYSIMYIYSVEIYPTVIRAKGLGINILFARLGSLCVPILVELVNPLLIFSGLGIVTFIFTFFLPETLNRDLEDDIEEEKKKVDAI